MRGRKGVKPDVRGSGEDLGGVEGRENHNQNVLCATEHIPSLFSRNGSPSSITDNGVGGGVKNIVSK